MSQHRAQTAQTFQSGAVSEPRAPKSKTSFSWKLLVGSAQNIGSNPLYSASELSGLGYTNSELNKQTTTVSRVSGTVVVRYLRMQEYREESQTTRNCTHSRTGARQYGHSCIRLAQVPHMLWWPHGTARWDFGRAMHTMHVVVPPRLDSGTS